MWDKISERDDHPKVHQSDKISFHWLCAIFDRIPNINIFLRNHLETLPRTLSCLSFSPLFRLFPTQRSLQMWVIEKDDQLDHFWIFLTSFSFMTSTWTFFAQASLFPSASSWKTALIGKSAQEMGLMFSIPRHSPQVQRFHL